MLAKKIYCFNSIFLSHPANNKNTQNVTSEADLRYVERMCRRAKKELSAEKD